MNRYALFTDVSLNPKLKLGFGAYLVIPSSFLEIPPERIIRSEFVEQIRLRRFEVTSSTKLEVQTLCGLLKISKKNYQVQGSNTGCIFRFSVCDRTPAKKISIGNEWIL